MHDLSIIVTLAGGLAVALAFGWATQRLGLSTLVGYMLAGIAVGLHTPGFVAEAARAVNPRIAIVATAAGEAERAWLQEFGVAHTCDPLEEASDTLLRAIHAGL